MYSCYLQSQIFYNSSNPDKIDTVFNLEDLFDTTKYDAYLISDFYKHNNIIIETVQPYSMFEQLWKLLMLRYKKKKEVKPARDRILRRG